MSTLRRQVGGLVKHHRERVGLTQAELADKVGLASETVSRIERGVVAPGFESLEEFASALSVDVRDFFGAGEFAASEGRNDALVRIVDIVCRLDAEDADWAEKLFELALMKRSGR